VSVQRDRRRRGARATKSRDVLKFVTRWEPNAFEESSSAVVKERLLSLGGRDLAYRMLCSGALSEEEEWNLKYVYAIAGSPQPRQRQFANIYDLVLYAMLSGFERANSGWIFRGQRDERFELIPSFFRTRPELLKPEAAAVVDHIGRVLQSEVFNRPYEGLFELHREIRDAWRRERKLKLDCLARQIDCFPIESLSEFEQDSAIQHYQSGTPFLDFTKSIIVASFFATHRFTHNSDPLPQKGAIYVVGPNDLQKELALGRVVSVELPPNFERPHRQKAVFVLTARPELLRDRRLFDVWTFYHTQAGADFESIEYGVSGRLLFPDLEEQFPGSPN
jgi:hypothetical protein